MHRTPLYTLPERRNATSAQINSRESLEGSEESSQTSSAKGGYLSDPFSRYPILKYPKDTTPRNEVILQQTENDAENTPQMEVVRSSGYHHHRQSTGDESGSVFQGIFSSPVSEDGLSVISTAMHLQGQNMGSAMFDDEYYPRRSSSGTNTQCSDDVSRRCHVFWNRHAGNPLAQLWSAHIRPALYSRTPRSLRQRRGKVLSPRSRNLQDLEYLTNQHKHKVGQLFHHQNEAHTEEEFFDFCLILQPQEVYGYWSTLLDFRQEVLGPLAEDDDESSNILRSIVNRVYSTDETDPSSCEDADVESAAEDPMRHKEYGFDPSIVQTPAARNSVLRRRATPQPSLNGTGASVDEDHGTVSFHHTPGQSVNGASVSRFHRHRSLPPSPGGLYSVVSRMSNASTMRRSLFERAIGSPCEDSKTFDPAANNNSIEMRISDAGMQRQALSVSFCNRTNELGTLTPAPNQTVIRRRWGNQAAGHRTPSMISPPIRSLTRGVSMTERKARPRVPARKFSADDEIGGDGQDDVERQENSNPNVIRIEDIPPQRFARGIASRTNGLLPFLSALKRGVVLRKHRPGQEAIFCKLYSEDGGDTIRFIVLDSNDAIHAFKEQRVRYNKIKYEGQADDIAPAQQWSLGRSDEDDDLDQNNKFSVPDYVAAKQYRDKMNRDKTLGRRINALAAKTVRGGSIKASDIVVVHPGSFSDPRSTNGELATASFRRSKSEYNNQLSFSLITRTDSLLSRANNSQMTIDECENRWLTGEGSESQFKYHDFEAATEGEYWLAFRGFLLLHRDAAVGRYAEQRAAGIGSHYSRLELEQREKADMDLQNQLHVDEFHEPVTAGFLERALAKLRGMDTSYMEGYTLPSAVPPPSDYFLGFRSPGTAIWSRLRQAGLETCRVYSLDPNRVMIKVRCPPERLMDVAEVLRLKLKTSDGSFAPFREDMMDFFEGLKDPLESPSNFDSSYCPFRSSLRQTIIDFIVGSRIRDSGAELSQNTDLGKMILARVPLHMHGKLNALYQSWFYFWRPSNWDGRDGRSLEHAPMDNVATEGNASLERSISSPVGSESLKSNQIPGRFKRFMIGSFYQPLDSIEQYFGEKVAFYFVWLQHTASHLVVLTAAGLLVFVIQICSGNWDHPIRPYFAMFVMLWTFVVLINWKKRANLMAYRWGTMNYKQQETTRPQFRGDYTLDDVTGEWVVTYPKWKRWAKYCISFPLTLLFTFGSLVLIFWVHANRDHQLANYLQYKYNPGSETYKIGLSLDVFGDNVPVVQLKLTSEILKDPTFWFIVAGLPSLLGLFLPLLNLILMKISVLLNDFENYRTESEYRTFLIIKVFSFRFVCYFATLYYYAFMSIGSDEALENGTLRYAFALRLSEKFVSIFSNISFLEWQLVFLSTRLSLNGGKTFFTCVSPLAFVYSACVTDETVFVMNCETARSSKRRSLAKYRTMKLTMS